MNRTQLIGRIVSDPIIRKSISGSDYLRFTLRVTRDNTPDNQHIVDYIPCFAVGVKAKAIVERCKAGDRLAIEGRMQSWTETGEDGKSARRIDVFVDRYEFLTPRKSKAEQKFLQLPRSSFQEKCYVDDNDALAL